MGAISQTGEVVLSSECEVDKGRGPKFEVF
jgi:hypothetical protein